MGCQCWCCLGQLVTNRWWVCSPPDQDERKGKEGSPIRGKEERSERWDGGNWGGGNQGSGPHYHHGQGGGNQDEGPHLLLE